MNKRKLVSAGIISTISIAIVLVFVFLAIPTIQAGSIMSSYSYKMFGSITEIDDLETIEDVSVENWDKADNSIRDFEVIESRNLLVKHNKSTYKIRAYVFANNEEAAQYYKSVKKVYPIGKFSMAGTVRILPHSDWMVYSENKIYYIEGKRFLSDFLDVLGLVFTQELGTISDMSKQSD